MYSRLLLANMGLAGPHWKRQTGGEPSASKQEDGSRRPWAYG